MHVERYHAGIGGLLVGDKRWKADLWNFFASALGFWILKEGSSKPEKILLGVVTLIIVALTVFT